MKVLITGAGGQLGWELQRTAPPGITLATPARAELDITDPVGVAHWFRKFTPDVTVNAAAYNAVDRAEEEPERCLAVNACAVADLARATTAAGARLIHFSSDFVFDGSGTRPYQPDALVNPLGVYGDSKRQGEEIVLQACTGRGLVVRTSWLYSLHGSNFVKSILALLNKRQSVSVVSDQIGSPTYAKSLAEVIWRIVDRPELSGLYHWSDAGAVSRFDWAVAIREEATARGMLAGDPQIVPVATATFPALARRPAFSVLDSSATCATLQIEAPAWRSALREMFDELEAQYR